MRALSQLSCAAWSLRPDAPPDWKAQAAEYLAQLTAVQRELAVLKGVQPSNATRNGGS